MGTPTRPVLRYHGGKWRLADWIIAHLPPHSDYVEPFAGAGSVLLRKPRAPRCEVLNDLNGRLVSAFRVLRDPRSATRLRRLLRLTPYSAAEHLAARERSDDPIEDARRLIVLGHQSHGSTGATAGKKTGWRRGVRAHGPSSSREWASLWRSVDAWCDRLRDVYLEQEDALSVIARWDSPATCFYVDPPYLHGTRVTHDGYGHEMDDAAHRRLAERLHQVEAHVILSGYPSDLYAELYAGWQRVSTRASADQGCERTEALWLSPRTTAALSRQQSFLGAGV